MTPRAPARVASRCSAVACLLSLLLLFGAGAGPARATGLPLEGIFESCRLDTQMQLCVDRLKTIHAAGFSVVVFPVGGASAYALWDYAAAARRNHMSIMWELSSPVWWEQPPTGLGASTTFPVFAAACKCTGNAWVLSFMIRWLAALPETYGYYAADDSVLPTGSVGAFPYYVRAIKVLDARHIVMIGTGDEAQTASYESMPDLIGAEIYPVRTSSLLPIDLNQPAWDEVANEITDTQRMADAANKESAFILQAFSWGDNLGDGIASGVCTSTDSAAACSARARYPSPLEQLQLRNEVLLHAHPRLILWWSFPGTYGSDSPDSYTTFPSGSVAQGQLYGLAWAIEEPQPLTPPPDGDRVKGARAHRARDRRARQVSRRAISA